METQVFKIKITKNDKDVAIFQAASRSTVPIVTSNLKAIAELLSDQAHGTMKLGMAPPSGIDQTLKKMLTEMN